ncbi:MAG: ferritin-like domain-containing protein [Planctomycetaceae bacterium]
MEIRAFAERVLLSPELELKLQQPDDVLTDIEPGPAVRHVKPVRSDKLQFAPPRRAPAMPRGEALRDPQRRAVAHHIMANHELQALEVMAWTLCAFPEAPAEFRSGMVWIMEEEQRHTRMHVERARKLGLEFGDVPVNCYIWKKAMEFQSPLDYVAGLPLVFEARNLDHTLEFAAEFDAVGDARSAALMRTIHDDEIRHVAFGIEWLRRMKPEQQTEWDVFNSHLHWPLRASKARGDVFQSEARRAAGLSEEFITRIQEADPA